MKVNLLILCRSPQSFDKDIVPPGAFTVHADTDVVLLFIMLPDFPGTSLISTLRARAYRDVYLHGCRAFGELSRVVVERCLPAACLKQAGLEQAAEIKSRIDLFGASLEGKRRRGRASGWPSRLLLASGRRDLHLITLKCDRSLGCSLCGAVLASVAGACASSGKIMPRPFSLA